GEVVVDQAHHFGAQVLQIREVLRVDDAELLAEHAIAHLDGGPGGEVVRVAAGEARLVQEAAVGVEVDAVERHLLQLLEQLALVVGAPAGSTAPGRRSSSCRLASTPRTSAANSRSCCTPKASASVKSCSAARQRAGAPGTRSAATGTRAVAPVASSRTSASAAKRPSA